MGESQADEEFQTVRELLVALGRACGDDDDLALHLEDYVVDYLTEHLGENLFVTIDEYEDREALSLYAKMSFYTDDAVNMWTLQFPVTIDEFHRYLDQLDLRVARLRAIVELATDAVDADSNDDVSVVEVLGRVFGASEAQVTQELGDDWCSLFGDDIAEGIASTPVRFLVWADRLVVGLDDEYVHLFAAATNGDTGDVGDVITHFDLGEEETISISEFARLLRMADTALDLGEQVTDSGDGSVDGPQPVRLLSESGAAFALLPVPSLSAANRAVGRTPVDLELLTPARLVRYLSRDVSLTFLEQLADALVQAATDPHPEQSVGTVEDRAAGLAVLVIDSAQFTVEVEFLINGDPDGDIPEQDGASFDLNRSSLISAAHDIQALLDALPGRGSR